MNEFQFERNFLIAYNYFQKSYRPTYQETLAYQALYKSLQRWYTLKGSKYISRQQDFIMMYNCWHDISLLTCKSIMFGMNNAYGGENVCEYLNINFAAFCLAHIDLFYDDSFVTLTRNINFWKNRGVSFNS